jgi:hypothetical protein
MGLYCSGDEYNRREDVAFAALSNTVRVVDDLLRFNRISGSADGRNYFS